MADDSAPRPGPSIVGRLLAPLSRSAGRYLGLYRALRILEPYRQPKWAEPPGRAIYVEPVGEGMEVRLPLLVHDDMWLSRAETELHLDDDVNRLMLEVWFDLRNVTENAPLDVRAGGGTGVVLASWSSDETMTMVNAFGRQYPKRTAFSITGGLDVPGRTIHVYVPPQLLTPK
jgi:hypothetical protein